MVAKFPADPRFPADLNDLKFLENLKFLGEDLKFLGEDLKFLGEDLKDQILQEDLKVLNSPALSLSERAQKLAQHKGSHKYSHIQNIKGDDSKLLSNELQMHTNHDVFLHSPITMYFYILQIVFEFHTRLIF